MSSFTPITTAPFASDNLTNIPTRSLTPSFLRAGLVLLAACYILPGIIASWQASLRQLLVVILVRACFEIMSPYTKPKSVPNGIRQYLMAVASLSLQTVRFAYYTSRPVLIVIAWGINRAHYRLTGRDTIWLTVQAYYEMICNLFRRWRNTLTTKVTRFFVLDLPGVYVLGRDIIDTITLRTRQTWSIIVTICHIRTSRIIQEFHTRFCFPMRVIWGLYRWVFIPIAVTGWFHFLVVTFILHYGEVEALCICVVLLLWILSKLEKPGLEKEVVSSSIAV